MANEEKVTYIEVEDWYPAWEEGWRRFDQFWMKLTENEKIALFSLWFARSENDIIKPIHGNSEWFNEGLKNILRYDGNSIGPFGGLWRFTGEITDLLKFNPSLTYDDLTAWLLS